ncbi:AsnC family transcriptional regulator [Desulfallas sp. Bu1-1]|jgi:DNA-binding Lrp family transcriptional regulator|uniref:siroheme decarboxylase subunit alpha n=1 Tax=Desulfallas sp. Bu1-1 TaxID=2787620 RepID=UPI0018A05799|nr:AsnC family transcriptional regulator [Desulfallas sp. Bu1-1]MBF7084541.1 AsnC family transcriptional regulator [Desulfallas sp. Bu1-1]
MSLDHIDRNILRVIQSDFPIVSEPYKQIAATVGITEEELLARLERLQQSGIIRRLGGLFDSRKLGYTGTLCAMKVPPGDIDRVAKIIDEYPGITHNYLRDHEYNMWFTLLAESKEKIDSLLNEIKERTGISHVLNLPSLNVFKVRVNFDISEVQDAE